MARGVNKVILVGTLGKDPDIRYGNNGDAMATISVATNESWKDKNGEKQERTEWHRVKFFGALAEIVGEYLKKGSQVYIEGQLRTSKYEKDGVDHYATDIMAREMQMLGPKPGGSDNDEQRERSTGRDSGRSASRDSGRGGREPERNAGRGDSRGGYGERDSGRSEARRPAPRNDEPFPDDDIPF